MSLQKQSDDEPDAVSVSRRRSSRRQKMMSESSSQSNISNLANKNKDVYRRDKPNSTIIEEEASKSDDSMEDQS